MTERLALKGVAADRIALFKNWLDPQAIKPLDDPGPLRATLGISPDKVVALYAGNMGEKQGLDTLLDVARRLTHRRDILLVVAGEGAARPRLEAAAKGLANVRFLPLQPAAEFNHLLNMADLHLLPQRANAADLVMPSKLIGMVGSGRPVIAGTRLDTEVAAIVGHCGLIVAPEDGAAMATAVETLADDRDQRLALGRAARAYAIAELGKATILEGFHRQLQHLVDK